MTNFLDKFVNWFQDMQNRRKVYQFLMACGPLLFLLGFVAPDDYEKWLQALAPLLLFGGATLAERNSREP